MVRDPSELRFGDGGYVIGEDGEIEPLVNGFDFTDAQTTDIEDRVDDTIDENATQQDKLSFVRAMYGFTPSNAEELNQIIGIHRARGRDAAKYVSVIMQHQTKALGEGVAVAAADSIAKDFTSYRDNARANAAFLLYLGEQVQVARQAGEAVENLGHIDDGTRRAIGESIRVLELHSFMESPETAGKFKFGKPADYRGRVTDFLKGSTLFALEDLAALTLDEQRSRLTFWTERIRELKRVVILKTLAERALGEA